MALSTFTWNANIVSGAAGSKKYSTLVAQFGDGYKQVAANGINNVSQSWPLTFKALKIDNSDLLEIMNFLDANQGFKSFYWTPPVLGAVQGTYRCLEGYQLTAESGAIYTLTATFEQSFLP